MGRLVRRYVRAYKLTVKAGGLVLDEAGTAGITLSAVYTDAILISGANTDGIHLSGANAYGINISGANTTAAISISAGTTIGLEIKTTVQADGILISAACTDGIHLSGACATNAINISAILTTGIAISSAAVDAILISGTGTDGIHISGVKTYGINISSASTTAAISISAGTTIGLEIKTTAQTDGILISAPCVDGIDISGACSATGINFTGTLIQGINFDDSALSITNNMGRNRCYFGVGTYSDHISLDLSAAATAGDRLYATQLFIDSIANAGHAAMYLQGAYYRINVTTIAQANLSVGVMCPTLDIDYNVKNAYTLKSELDMSATGLTIGQNAFAVSGYLEVATSGALDVSGCSGIAAITADFAGGTGLTLTGTSRTFALKANVYSGATATGALCVRVDGSGIVTDGISIECGATATMTNALAFNAMGGMTYFCDFEAVAGFLSTSIAATTVTHKLAVNVGGAVRYIKLYSDA